MLAWIGMTVGLIAISTHDMLLRLVDLIALNPLVLCAFKVKENSFFHSIVIIVLFLPFPF